MLNKTVTKLIIIMSLFNFTGLILGSSENPTSTQSSLRI